jgi:DNA-binding GntR family transcriptional regulator
MDDTSLHYERVQKLARIYSRLIDQGLRCGEQDHCEELHQLSWTQIESTNPELVAEALTEHVRHTMTKLKGFAQDEEAPRSNC